MASLSDRLKRLEKVLRPVSRDAQNVDALIQEILAYEPKPPGVKSWQEPSKNA